MSNRELDPRNFSSIAHAAQTPDKFAVLKPEPEHKGAHRGQVVVLFAAFLVGLMGMLGLATDVGYALAARRSVQGAADAGAMAGAREIARWKSTAPTSAFGATKAVVLKNTFNAKSPTAPALSYCQYLDHGWGELGDCSATVPSTAAGIRVRTKLTVNTFFIRAVPLAPKTVTVVGEARARVMRAKAGAPGSPFLVCGWGSWNVTGSSTGNGGTSTDILASDSPFKINPAAYGKVFRIHDSQESKKFTANCTLPSSDWKGINDQVNNDNLDAPGWFNWTNGTVTGPVMEATNGIDGCKKGAEAPYNCVMLVPIATYKNGLTPTQTKVYVVGYGAFYVTEVNQNTHNGQLLDGYIVDGDGINDWTPDSGLVVTIRLVW